MVPMRDFPDAGPIPTNRIRLPEEGMLSSSRGLVTKILAGRSDRNIALQQLRTMLVSFGLRRFKERIRGDHHIFGRTGIVETLNIRPLPSGKAKSYQLRQVRSVVLRYRLAERKDGN